MVATRNGAHVARYRLIEPVAVAPGELMELWGK